MAPVLLLLLAVAAVVHGRGVGEEGGKGECVCVERERGVGRGETRGRSVDRKRDHTQHQHKPRPTTPPPLGQPATPWKAGVYSFTSGADGWVGTSSIVACTAPISANVFGGHVSAGWRNRPLLRPRCLLSPAPPLRTAPTPVWPLRAVLPVATGRGGQGRDGQRAGRGDALWV